MHTFIRHWVLVVAFSLSVLALAYALSYVLSDRAASAVAFVTMVGPLMLWRWKRPASNVDWDTWGEERPFASAAVLAVLVACVAAGAWVVSTHDISGAAEAAALFFCITFLAMALAHVVFGRRWRRPH